MAKLCFLARAGLRVLPISRKEAKDAAGEFVLASAAWA
jgi:hypothetical protein